MNEGSQQPEPKPEAGNARLRTGNARLQGDDAQPRPEEEAARLSRSLILVSLSLSFAGAVAAGILAGLVWRDVTILYGFLLGAAAATAKTLFLVRGIRRLAAEKHLPGATALLISLLLFGAALAAAGYISRRALIAAPLALAIPYVSVIIVSVTGRSEDRSRKGDS